MGGVSRENRSLLRTLKIRESGTLNLTTGEFGLRIRMLRQSRFRLTGSGYRRRKRERIGLRVFGFVPRQFGKFKLFIKGRDRDYILD